MKLFLISDNTDALAGMRLAGVDGVFTRSRDEVEAALNQALANAEIGILLIAEQLAAAFPELIGDIKLNRSLPLIVEIPGRHGTNRRPDFIESYIREAIGVKL